MAKKPKLGSGKRFAALTRSLRARGVKNPRALAAAIGRKKFGAKKIGPRQRDRTKHGVRTGSTFR